MSSRKSFNVNVTKDDDDKVEISLSDSYDFSTDMEYGDLVSKLESVFSNLSDQNKDTQTRSIGFMGQGTEEKK